MQYEVLERNEKYRWELYSRYGYPLRNILANGVCDTKEEAEQQAQQALRHNQKHTLGHTIAYADDNMPVSVVKYNDHPSQEITMEYKPTPKDTSQQEFICKEINGEMVIYAIKEIARYKMYKPQDIVTDKYLEE